MYGMVKTFKYSLELKPVCQGWSFAQKKLKKLKKSKKLSFPISIQWQVSNSNKTINKPSPITSKQRKKKCKFTQQIYRQSPGFPSVNWWTKLLQKLFTIKSEPNPKIIMEFYFNFLHPQLCIIVGEKVLNGKIDDVLSRLKDI